MSKVEAQETWWCGSNPIQRPKNQGSQWSKSHSEFKEQGTPMLKAGDGCPNSRREQICISSALLFNSCPQQMGWLRPTSYREGRYFLLRSPMQKPITSRNILIDAIRNKILPAILAFLDPATLCIKVMFFF